MLRARRKVASFIKLEATEAKLNRVKKALEREEKKMEKPRQGLSGLAKLTIDVERNLKQSVI